MSKSNGSSAPDCFPTTEWTQLIQIIQKGDENSAGAALVEFCERYRPAIYKFFRRRGHAHERAEDYTQSFFLSRILGRWDDRKSFLHTIERREGRRFRSFLCRLLWCFLKDQWKTETRAKAGGGAPHVPLDDVERLAQIGDESGFEQFGSEFDRVFAMEIIQKAAGRSPHSRCLEDHFKGQISQKEAALELGMHENTFKQAYARFRERLARDLWSEVSKLAGPDEKEIRAEIAYLMSLFA